MNVQKKNWCRYGIYLLFGVFYFWMVAQIPYTHDDWDWGLSIGMEQLLTASLNGRYAGNLLEVVMTRSELLKTVIMGTCCFLIPFLLAFLAAKEQKENRMICFLFCNCLLLTMDRAVWQQAYGWIAGFANYGISAVFMAVWLRELLLAFADEAVSPKGSAVQSGLLFGASLLGQLFLENLALYCLLLAGLLCLVWYKRVGKIPGKILWMLAGAVIGLILTFSSGIYNTLWSTGKAVDGYRTMVIGGDYGIGGSVFNLLWQIIRLAPMVYEENLILCAALLVLMSLLLIREKEKKCRNMALVAVNLALLAYFVVNQLFGGYSEDSPRKMQLGFGVNGLFFLAVAVEVILLYKARKWQMYKLLVIWVSAPVVIAPIAATTMLAERLFFTSNVFLIFFALAVLCDVLRGKTVKTGRAACLLTLAAATVLVWGHWNVYREIGQCKAQRDGIIAEAVEKGETTIVLPKFPHEEYLFWPDPTYEIRWGFFKEFYGIPEEVTVVIE